MESLGSNVYARIAAIAVFSRSLFILLSYAPNMFFERFDKSTALSPSRSVFRHLLSWDAVHFLSIADRGYSYEHSVPFFPLTPLVVRTLPFSDNLTKAVVLNSLCFVVSAALLFKISIRRYSYRISFLSTLFFIFNPASIVYCSFYSESLFCLLFLIAFHYLSTGRMLRASVFLGLCSLTRSNAVMCLIFLKSAYFAPVLLPAALFQLYALLAIMRARCSFRVFVPYSYVQAEYWGQGFLKFITIKNIPNMLFGAAFIAYCCYVIKLYAESRIYLHEARGGGEERPAGGRECSAGDGAAATPYIAASGEVSVGRWIAHKIRTAKAPGPRSVLDFVKDPFFTDATSLTTKLVIVLGLQTLMLIFFIHWNMAFRFVSFNPFLYWSFAFLAARYSMAPLFRLAVGFFLAYGVMYAVLFGAFYPPA